MIDQNFPPKHGISNCHATFMRRKKEIPEIHNFKLHGNKKVIGEMALKSDTIYYMRRAETTGGEKDEYNRLIDKSGASNTV